MQRLIFILICTLLLLKPTANAIFLSNLGVENLPFAYLALAFLAFGITIFYNKYVSTISTRKLFIKTTLINIFLLILIGFMLFFSWSKVFTAFIFYLFISIFGILSASQFWIIANQVFNAREARKYFGFIGSGAIAGGIIGGYLASIITSVTQSEIIPFAAAGLLIYSIYLVKKIKKPIEKPTSFEDNINYFKQIFRPFKFVRDIKHLRYLSILLAISVFTAKLIDYQFGYFATQIYTAEEELTQFYGFWFSTFNIVSLLIQLLLTSRIVGKLGVGYSLLILPSLIIINISILILLPILLVVVSIKLIDASMKQSINKASTELMMLPVPEDIKLKTKTFLDVFVDSLATGLSGLILLFVVKGLDLPNQIISIVILLGAFMWFFVGNKMRMEYKSIFRKSLKIQSESVNLKNTTIVEDYAKIFMTGTEFQILKSLAFLKTKPIQGIIPEVIKLLRHENPLIIAASLEIIMYDDEDYHDQVLPLLNHGNQNVKINAFEYLINHQQSLEPDFLLKLLDDAEEDIKIAAIAAYSKEFQNNRQALKILRIGDRIKSKLDTHNFGSKEELFISIGLLKAISLGKFSDYYNFIIKGIHSNSLPIKNHAIIAAGETKTSKFLKILLELVNTDYTEPSLYQALAKFGSKRLEFILNTRLENQDILLVRKFPAIFELIPDQRSIDILQQLAEHDDYVLKNNAITSLYKLMEKYPLLKIDDVKINKILLNEAKYNNTLLNILLKQNGKSELKEFQSIVRILKKRIDDNLSIIFKLLHIKYPPENYLEIYEYVNGPDQTLRDNSIEYLENTLGPQLKSSIISLIEYNVLHSLDETLKRNNLKEEDIKEFLLKNRDPDIKNAALEYYNP